MDLLIAVDEVAIIDCSRPCEDLTFLVASYCQQKSLIQLKYSQYQWDG